VKNEPAETRVWSWKQAKTSHIRSASCWKTLEVGEAESHNREMLMLAERLTRGNGGEARLFALIDHIAALFRDYFTQLAALKRIS
jgi:hypothetical protein